MITRRSLAFPLLLVLVVAAWATAACGKKGPPLAPLRLVPEPVGELTARRLGSKVLLSFVIPAKNQNGAGAVDLDRIEVYGVTVTAGSAIASPRDLVAKQHLIGSIGVKPPASEEKPPTADSDKRPSPGDRATFVEELTDDKLRAAAVGRDQPTGEKTDAAPTQGVRNPGAPGPRTEPLVSEFAARIYVIRSVSRGGRSAPDSRRIAVPLVVPPPVPGAVAVQPAERAYVLDWTPPVSEPGQSAITFNVYGQDPSAPLNASPVSTGKFEHGPVRPGEALCFTVRSVQTVHNVPIESEASAPACATWTDIYPPAAPRGLQAVAADDGVSLSWDANAEEDVAGYVVLRGEAPGETLQPLTREPIRETNFRDTTVKSGVTYVYALVALDKATPPNTSAQSDRQEVTAR